MRLRPAWKRPTASCAILSALALTSEKQLTTLEEAGHPVVRILVPAALDLGAECLALRNRCKVATTLGYGPRYLHATGQLHKGGPHTVVVLMFTADVHDDLPIPGEPLGFATLQRAQALGISRRLPPTVGGCCVL